MERNMPNPPRARAVRGHHPRRADVHNTGNSEAAVSHKRENSSRHGRRILFLQRYPRPNPLPKLENGHGQRREPHGAGGGGRRAQLGALPEEARHGRDRAGEREGGARHLGGAGARIVHLGPLCRTNLLALRRREKQHRVVLDGRAASSGPSRAPRRASGGARSSASCAPSAGSRWPSPRSTAKTSSPTSRRGRTPQSPRGRTRWPRPCAAQRGRPPRGTRGRRGSRGTRGRGGCPPCGTPPRTGGRPPAARARAAPARRGPGQRRPRHPRGPGPGPGPPADALLFDIPRPRLLVPRPHARGARVSLRLPCPQLVGAGRLRV